MDAMWQEYGMEELEKGMQKLFPASRISVAELMGQLLQGDVLGAAGTLLQEVIQGMGASAAGRKNILIWLIVLGILSALLIHFVEVFDKHQIADLSFYFIYLLMGVILLQCFSGILGTARETVENIVLFVRLMVPTYLLAVGVASGPATVGAGYQLMLLLIYGTEKILLGVVLPLIYCYGLLTMINGIWVEEKLTLLTELLEKAVGWILKAFKENWKQGIPLGLIFLAAVYAAYLDFEFFNKLPDNPIIFLIAGIVTIFFIVMIFLYAFPLSARYENTLPATMKNSIRIATKFFVRTIFLIAILAIEVMIFIWNQTTLLFGILIGPACFMLTVSGFAMYYFKQIEKEPGAITNPEDNV